VNLNGQSIIHYGAVVCAEIRNMYSVAGRLMRAVQFVCFAEQVQSERQACRAGLNRLVSARCRRNSDKTRTRIGGVPNYTWRWSPTPSDVMNNLTTRQRQQPRQQQLQQSIEALLPSKRRCRRCLWMG